eukprot:CAMPEP_0172696884 /NCGR_PEP_ID=MMETSP1074-20121228/28361_1 /TAXON_ID=2916 /ORGANISM="Ceratium fusus, Strain PA161109" /LENGTH=40 /DNA_ID= /DNA_START= /DNA_END= /DNA_ORIENTATION=
MLPPEGVSKAEKAFAIHVRCARHRNVLSASVKATTTASAA